MPVTTTITRSAEPLLARVDRDVPGGLLAVTERHAASKEILVRGVEL